MRNFKKLGMAILSVAITLLLVGCNSRGDGSLMSDTESDAERLAEPEITQGIENLEPVIILDKALDIFFETFDDETINLETIQIEKDNDGNYHYLIEGWDANYDYELKIDVETAEIIRQVKKAAIDLGGILDLEEAITPKEAMDEALAVTEKEAVEGWKLKVEENQMIYEIIFLNGSTQKVDALTGEVL